MFCPKGLEGRLALQALLQYFGSQSAPFVIWMYKWYEPQACSSTSAKNKASTLFLVRALQLLPFMDPMCLVAEIT